MTKLRISDELALPLDTMTEVATVVYGTRGTGKTTFGSVVAEEITKCRQRFGGVDLKGDLWGFKSSADGKAKGIPLVVFGGDHADVPLEPDAGVFIADTVATLGQSFVLDLEHLSKGKQIRFLADFFERLYHVNRERLYLILDEAQRYAPQGRLQDPESTRCLGAVEDVVKLGRKHGLTPMLLTQRGSGLNKEVEQLCEMLVAFRTPGALDKKRVKEWLEGNFEPERYEPYLREISKMRTGTALFASAHPDLPVFGVYPVRRRETFDSSATPKLGERRAEPRVLAEPDLEAIKVKMAAAIERAKADDPVELKKTIATLRRENAALQKATAPTTLEVKYVEKAVLKDGQLTRAEKIVERLDALAIQVRSELGGIKSALSAVSSTVQSSGRDAKPHSEDRRGFVDGTAVRAGVRAPVNGAGVAGTSAEGHPRGATISGPSGRGQRGTGRSAVPPTLARTTDGISGPQQRMLDALAWLESIGAPGAKWSVLAFLSGQSPKSSGFEKNVSTLRSNGYLLGNGKTVGFELSEEGSAIARSPQIPATSEQLHRAIYAKISTPQERMLRSLIDVYPRNLTWDELAQRGEQSPTSSGFEKNVSTLKSYGLIDGGRGTGYVALGHLFLEGATR